MAQITDDFARQMLRYCSHQEHPPLTVWEAEQLARAWLDREVLRAERDIARTQVQTAIRILTGIHSLLYPARVTDKDGRVWEFKHHDDAHSLLQELSDRIRAIPDELAKLNGG